MRTDIDPALARRAAADGIFFSVFVLVAQLAGHLPLQYGTVLVTGAGIACLRYVYLRWRSPKASL